MVKRRHSHRILGKKYFSSDFYPYIVTVVLQEADFNGKENIVKPGIGIDNCFLDEGEPRWFYFHIVNAPILVSNFESISY